MEPGTVIAGKYRLEKLLGQGGMGSVWTAHHHALDTTVAIKFMDPALVQAADARSRFEREARAAAKLRSAHVVQILDHGIDRTPEGNELPFIVMELLEGEDLFRRLRRRGEIPLAELAPLMLQVGRALQKAHEQGIIHRDLKPENIFLVKEDDAELVKVLDFGIAKDKKSIADPMSAGTRTGTIMGTPAYMSPEQAQGNKTVDARSDIWSLGVIVFQCLTGVVPFESDGLGDLIIKICMAPLPSASAMNPVLPPAIDAFFARALARDPDQRFQTARELTAALAEIAGIKAVQTHTFADPESTSGGRSSQLGAPLQTMSSQPTLKPATSGIDEHEPPRKPTRLVTLAIGAAVTVGVVGVVAFVGLRRTGEAQSAAQPEPAHENAAPGIASAVPSPTPLVTPAAASADAPATASAAASADAPPSPPPSARTAAPVAGPPAHTTAPPPAHTTAPPARATARPAAPPPPATKKPRDYGY